MQEFKGTEINIESIQNTLNTFDYDSMGVREDVGLNDPVCKNDDGKDATKSMMMNMHGNEEPTLH